MLKMLKLLKKVLPIKLTFLLIVFFVNVGLGQSTQARKVINQYINYVNHCNIYISASHYSVKDYNLKLLNNFKEPEYFYAKTDFFELECHPGSIPCTQQLDVDGIKKEKEDLQKSISTLDAHSKQVLSNSLNRLDDVFEQLVLLVEGFEEKRFDKEYFVNLSNIEAMEAELNVYKNIISKLDLELQTISKECDDLFNESSLPKPLERTKKVTRALKKFIHDYNHLSPTQRDHQMASLQELIDQSDLGSELERMGSFGDFDYLDNSQTQERANIERDAESTLRLVKRIENVDIKNPFSYGIRTYDKLFNPELHYKVYKIESLSLFFNDNTSSAVVRNYNNYIERANQPMLKIIGIVLPYEIIQIEIKRKQEVKEEPEKKEVIKDTIKVASKPVFSKNDIHTLAGAKTNNLVLLLDISSSMSKGNKMDNLKTAVTYLIDLLRPEDQLTVLIYANKTELLFSSNGENYSKAELKAKIDALKPKGSTNIKNALDEAYKYCDERFVKNGNNKIIIATDGMFVISKKGKKRIRKSHIKLSAFHFKSKGMQKNEETILKEISKLGKGKYTLVNGELDAIKALVLEAKEQ